MPANPYRQLSPLARALELVGDRWTLLIIAELLVAPKRYTDLANSLSGIPTNLLRDRVRRLEDDQLLTRFEAPPPIATSLYELTARGRELESTILALLEWGGPLLADDSRSDEPMFLDSLVLPLRARLRGTEIAERMVVAFSIGDAAPTIIEIVGDKVIPVTTRVEVDTEVTATSASALARVLAGIDCLDEAESAGTITLSGDRSALLELL
ncbi:MAG: helix-turn-helix transcriptional regulator [bacterium]|nr:helix-turn-helix transcriptional regulator [bacterium]